MYLAQVMLDSKIHALSTHPSRYRGWRRELPIMLNFYKAYINRSKSSAFHLIYILNTSWNYKTKWMWYHLGVIVLTIKHKLFTMLSTLSTAYYESLSERMNYPEMATLSISSYYTLNKLVLSKELRIMLGTTLSVQ